VYGALGKPKPLRSSLPAPEPYPWSSLPAPEPYPWSASHPSDVTDLSPPSAALESGAGSGAVARKLGKQPVPAPRDSGGVASTQDDAPGGAGGSRSHATTPAMPFQHVRLGTVIKDGYYLLNNPSGNSSALARGLAGRADRH
jgi:hypothetical protein